MAGRRLLDAAKLLHASSNVARRHFDLRSRQLDVYSKTSTVAKKVKSQTDRVTVTVQAAIALAQRFSEDIPQYSSRGSDTQQDEYTSKSAADQSGNPAFDEAVFEASGPDVNVSKGKASGMTGNDAVIDSKTRVTSIPPDLNVALDSPKVTGFGRSGSESQAKITGSLASTSKDIDPSISNLAENQDVPPKSATPTTPLTATGSPNSSTAQHDVPGDVDLNVFRTTKGSGLLGGRSPYSKFAQELRTKQHEQQIPSSNEQLKHQQQELVNPTEVVEEPLVSRDPEPVHDPVPSPNVEETSVPAVETYKLRESRVPSSRLGRIWQYSGLATSMAFGVVGESLRRVTGSGDDGSLVLSPANMERLVAKLSRMRGAALKLGQMISFQDSKVLPPQINEVLRRVQDGADYMPASQRDKVLARNLGADWKDLFSSFDDVPIAAASIGQVHKAVLRSTGMAVAVKVQYPGVASSINSDLNNISLLLTASRLLPRGLFLDKTIANARTELGWECDYIREAESQRRFKQLLTDDTEAFTVPAVISEASGKEVITGELMTGVGVAKLPSLTQPQRDWIGTQILRLCLREITEFRFMQSDPNWTNFLYNQKDKKLELLDFGASRDYPQEFIDPYMSVLMASSRNDRDAVRDFSVQLGYLTGHESQAMVDAHVDSVLTLAEPFGQNGPQIYDFRDQTITDRVRALIPVMLRERLAPPPEETYSLHRKLSGAFLLCAKLGSRVPCQELFSNAVDKYQGKKPL